MRKLAFVLAFLCVGLVFMAAKNSGENNTNSTPVTQTPQFAYCELVGISKFMSTKVSIVVDFGQADKDKRLKDENGKAKTFNSMVDALNYMGSQGWEFVQAYAVTEGSQNVYHFLLKKEINKLTTEEKASLEGGTKE